ncbi:MAG: hypothetical protein J6C78_03100 [Muribaculaceae bacterium]|nr:hypothetical protein [Muribaculaceae bacterium]
MKNLLFPRQFQALGWLLFVPAFILGVLIINNMIDCEGTLETILNDAAIIGITIGSIFIVCSKEKCEDEMIRSIRLASLLNALYVYGIILIVAVLLINGIAFAQFMAINLVLLPLIYFVVFRFEIYRYNKMSGDEE